MQTSDEKSIVDAHQKNSVRGAISSLGIGASIAFPLSRASYVRSLASDLGLILGRHYSTCVDRDSSFITITRKD
jgi:hypothetical protein